MIFASDLDQTLIYSVRSKGDFPLEEMEPVELYEGRHISYMTKPARAMLVSIAAQMHFIPVTTRTPAQYGRIFGIREELAPDYAIASNGGKVLYQGEEDLEWSEQIRLAVTDGCALHGDVLDLFNELASEEWVRSADLCDDLFYSIVVDRSRVPLDEIGDFQRLLASLGWSYSLQGRKVYLMPQRVSKGGALNYVKARLGSHYAYAAGDSLLDESLLLAADEAWSPSHGELRQHYDAHPHIRFTQNTGAMASEELLEAVLTAAGTMERASR